MVLHAQSPQSSFSDLSFPEELFEVKSLLKQLLLDAKTDEDPWNTFYDHDGFYWIRESLALNCLNLDVGLDGFGNCVDTPEFASFRLKTRGGSSEEKKVMICLCPHALQA